MQRQYLNGVTSLTRPSNGEKKQVEKLSLISKFCAHRFLVVTLLPFIIILYIMVCWLLYQNSASTVTIRRVRRYIALTCLLCIALVSYPNNTDHLSLYIFVFFFFSSYSVYASHTPSHIYTKHNIVVQVVRFVLCNFLYFFFPSCCTD